ncbi:MAG: 2-oxo acid dehydrogenase subunit E2 [Candidatus Obscuribacterales bacterium]|jgi:pyruvate/2-oxoglutarate dehydrogenase complex dihydrolipoamide acyltransferase (E2) component|nr:2-oxo acid dehydrogenase subunit E2 [Candidatus Obscuribacterales bacterium]
MERHSYKKLRTGRKTVLDLLTMISSTAVPCYLIRDIDMSWATKTKADLQNDGSKITVTAILMKAIAEAQKLHPTSRSEILPFGRIVTYENIVGGFTIERREDGGDTVFFGEIERPDTKSLTRIAEELTNYARKDTSELPPLALQKIYAGLPYFLRRLIILMGTLFPSLRLKCQKATFGLTTLGKYNVRCVLSPCVCTSTFGIGTIESRPVVHQGAVVIRPVMTISFNYNAKVIDASDAASFLDDVCDLMEGRVPRSEINAVSKAAL